MLLLLRCSSLSTPSTGACAAPASRARARAADVARTHADVRNRRRARLDRRLDDPRLVVVALVAWRPVRHCALDLERRHDPATTPEPAAAPAPRHALVDVDHLPHMADHVAQRLVQRKGARARLPSPRLPLDFLPARAASAAHVAHARAHVRASRAHVARTPAPPPGRSRGRSCPRRGSPGGSPRAAPASSHVGRARGHGAGPVSASASPPPCPRHRPSCGWPRGCVFPLVFPVFVGFLPLRLGR